MKNAELWKQYEDYTKELTSNARKLGFAAAALCWILRDANGVFPQTVLYGLGFAILFFVADLLQFVIGAILIRSWTRSEEKKKWAESGSLDGEYEKPAWIDYPSYSLWFGKIVFLFISFLLLGIHVFLQR